MPNRLEGDTFISGQLTASSMVVPNSAVVNASVSSAAAIARSKLAQELKTFVVLLTDFRVHDAPQTVLPGTSATDDLGLYGVTFGTDVMYVATSDLKAAGATTRYARVMIQLPAEYDAGETVQIRVVAGMLTTVADTTATVDVEAYLSGKDGAVDGADLVTTAATTINSLTFSNKDFAVTATSLDPGDWLDVRITVAVNDAATGTAVIGCVASVELMCDVRG